jgi:hypothetical protein
MAFLQEGGCFQGAAGGCLCLSLSLLWRGAPEAVALGAARAAGYELVRGAGHFRVAQVGDWGLGDGGELLLVVVGELLVVVFVVRGGVIGVERLKGCLRGQGVAVVG